MEQDAVAFTAEVLSLTQQLAPDLAALPPDQAIAQLHLNLQNAKADKQEQGAHLRRRAAEIKRQEQAHENIGQMERKLAGLCIDAKCETSELWSAWERSSTRTKLEAKLAEIEQRLLMVAGGRTLEEFLAETAAADPDSLPGRIDGIARDLSELKGEREKLNDELLQLRQDEASMAGGDRAARLMEDLAGVQASLAGNVAEYIKLRSALFVLRKAVERYREKHQGPVLGRASDIFAGLTAGSFAKLRIDHNDAGDPVLVGIRADRSMVQIDGMSDGTRDQLYLALRIASLENYLDAHEPMPFIVDDVLVNFDDARATAALKALAELSAKTQVIFFTHHEHLVRLAQEHLDSSVLYPRRLD